MLNNNRPSSASGSQEKRNPYKLPAPIRKASGTTKIEWEKLYEESMQLKTIVNSLKDENTKLKTRNVNLEKDLQKCTRIIEEMEQTGTMKRFYQKPSTDNQMILSLRNQVKQLTNELSDAHQELQNIKRSAKFTLLTELEIECKQFQDETIRLAKIIEEVVQDSMYRQQQEDDQGKMKDQLGQREQLIQQMQQELEYQVNENKQLSEKLSQMVQAYQELDKMYSKYQNEAKNKIKIKDKQISELKNDIERTSVRSVTIKKPKLDKSNITTTTKRDQSYISVAQKDLIESAIQIEQLQDICLEVRVRLSAAQIQILKLDSYLFSSSGASIDYCSLHDRLTKQPFLLDKPDAILLARYLIEKYTQQYPYNSNINLTQSTLIVRALFVRLVGFWPVYDQIEEKIIEFNIHKLFEGLQSNLELRLNGQMMTHRNLWQALDQVLSTKHQQLRKVEFGYILIKIIRECQNIQKLNGSLVTKFIKELSGQETTIEDLQKFYSRKRNYFFYKQLRLKQEQLLALFDTEKETSEQKSAQVYIMNNGLVRSQSEPDHLNEEDSEYEEQIKKFQEKFQEDDEDEYSDDQQQLDEHLNQMEKTSQSYREDDFENYET